MTPAQAVRAACDRVGEETVAGWCVALLLGSGDAAPAGLTYADLGGFDSPSYGDPWPRVWGARGLRYCWRPDAVPAVVAALSDEAWRVREHAAAVVRDRDLGQAGDAVVELVDDEVERVRIAALRAVAVVGEAEHADAVRRGQDDPEPRVRDAATVALHLMGRRLDREL